MYPSVSQVRIYIYTYKKTHRIHSCDISSNIDQQRRVRLFIEKTSIRRENSRTTTPVARLSMLRKGRKFFSRVKRAPFSPCRAEDEPHACAVTDRLRIQGQPMTPDTVADGAERRVGEVNERQGDLSEKGEGRGEDRTVRTRFGAERVGKWRRWRERGAQQPVLDDHSNHYLTDAAVDSIGRHVFVCRPNPCNLLSPLLSFSFCFIYFSPFLLFFPFSPRDEEERGRRYRCTIKGLSRRKPGPRRRGKSSLLARYRRAIL